MELNQESFEKLDQLDRIEFRQRRDVLNERLKAFGWGKTFLKAIAVFLIFLALVVPQGYLVWGYGFVRDISSFVASVVLILFVFSVFGYVTDFILKKKREKEIEELESQYFTIEVKNKSRNKKK